MSLYKLKNFLCTQWDAVYEALPYVLGKIPNEALVPAKKEQAKIPAFIPL
jgi:hypothetical protein